MVGVNWGADISLRSRAWVKDLRVVLILRVFGGEFRWLTFEVSWVGKVVHFHILPWRWWRRIRIEVGLRKERSIWDTWRCIERRRSRIRIAETLRSAVIRVASVSLWWFGLREVLRILGRWHWVMHWRKITKIWVGILPWKRRVNVQISALVGERRRKVLRRSAWVNIALRNHIGVVLLVKILLLPKMASRIAQATVITLAILRQILLKSLLHHILLLLLWRMPFLLPPLIRWRRLSSPLKRRDSHILLHFLFTEPLLCKPLLDPFDILRCETLIEIEISMILADFSPIYMSSYLSALKASSVMHLAHSIR